MNYQYGLLVILFICMVLLLNEKNPVEHFNNFKVDNIFVINLDRETEKMGNLKKDLHKNNLFYERFPAINGQKLTENDPSIKKYFGDIKIKYSMGQKCCTLSHIYIWKEILRRKTQYNIILEDDVIIPSELYSKLNIYMKQLPEDWDFLFLGGNRIIGTEYSKNLVYPAKKRVNGNYGTFAYLINSKNLAKILDNCKNIVEHTDVFIQRTLSKKFKIFFANPQLIEHNYNTISNIRQRNRSGEAKRNNTITIL